MMEKMREAFEAWYVSIFCKGGVVNMPINPRNGEYRSPQQEIAWWAWQASRASLMIELPKKYVIGGIACDAHDRAIDMCREVIETAGVKVKP